jgi:hypothetical protein
MTHFIKLREAQGGFILINSSNVQTISEGLFKEKRCTWVRFETGKNQAVEENLEEIEKLLGLDPT